LHPELLVILDAADMGLPPGTLRRLDPDAIHGRDFGTHAPSIGQLAGYLSDCAGRIVILGIQPATTATSARLSPPVRAALRALGRSLAQNQIPE
jgi:hydrogenase 3 maturation protease